MQFKFEFVGRCDRYPLGVKQSYRSHCCDEVVEIKETDYEESNSLDSGFQAWLTEVSWQPAAADPPLNILQDIPLGDVLPRGFVTGSHSSMEATMRSIHSYFAKRTDVVGAWQSFNDQLPDGDLVQPYIIKNELHVPMLKELFGVKVSVDHDSNVDPVLTKHRSYNGAPLPKQKSTCSIKHSGNLRSDVPSPRISLEPTHENSPLEHFRAMCKKMSTLKETDFNKSQFQDLCVQVGLASYGTKKVLLER